MATDYAEAVARVAREWAAGPRAHEPLVLRPSSDGSAIVAEIGGGKMLLSVREAAARMGVGVSTFRRRYLDTGLVSKRLGKVPVGELERVEKRCRS